MRLFCIITHDPRQYKSVPGSIQSRPRKLIYGQLIRFGGALREDYKDIEPICKSFLFLVASSLLVSNAADVANKIDGSLI